MKLSQSSPPRMPARSAMVTSPPPASEVWQPLLTGPEASPFALSAQDGPFGSLLVLPDNVADGASDSGSWVAPLSDLMVLKVSGDDALPFLQGQLTNNLETLADQSAQRSGLCSPKGRLLGDFIAVRMGSGFFLLVSGAICESIHKRLAMFVLRAKVNIENVTQTAPPVGLVSPRAEAPAHWPAPLEAFRDDDGRLYIGLEPVRIGDESSSRVIALLPTGLLAADLSSDQSEGRSYAPTNWWHATEALAGTPRIGIATSDAFVPQMVNFELVGGVSFQKGCFPGQEVVARTQYLGKLKRRLQLGWVSGAANAIPGAEINDSTGSAVGTIVLVGPGEAVGQPGQQVVLFEARLAALENNGQLRIEDAPVTLAALPYEIPVAERFERPDL